MGSLPEELWMHILQIGVQNGQLHHRDLCALAILCRPLRRVCGSDCVWKQLVSVEFPEPGVGADGTPFRKPGSEGALADWKSIFKMRFEKVKRKKVAEHRRQMLRVASSLHAMQKENQDYANLLKHELDVQSAYQKQLENLDRASQSATALRIWQPHAVSTQHEQVVQQIPVDLPAQRNFVQMQLQVCKWHILCIKTSMKSRQSVIEERKKELDALSYNPIQGLSTRDPPENKAVFVKPKIGKKRKSTGH